MRPAPSTRRAWARGLAAGLIAALALAGCGGDDDPDEGSAPPPATGTSTAPAAPAEPLVITVDGRTVDMAGIGTAKPLLEDGIRTFGPPTTARVIDDTACHVRWSAVGLFAIYANLGGQDPCDPQEGRLQGATVTSERWRTVAGLAVGAPVAELHRLYPNAEPDENRWTLTRAPGPGGEAVGVLGATEVDARIRSLQAYVGAAGD